MPRVVLVHMNMRVSFCSSFTFSFFFNTETHSAAELFFVCLCHFDPICIFSWINRYLFLFLLNQFCNWLALGLPLSVLVCPLGMMFGRTLFVLLSLFPSEKICGNSDLELHNSWNQVFFLAWFTFWGTTHCATKRFGMKRAHCKS